MTKLLQSAAVVLFLAAPALAQDFQHQRRIPHRPDRPSIRDMVTQKYELREETLRRSLKQREAVIEDHESGRKLLNDEDLNRHHHQIKGIRRKLAIIKTKDKALRDLEIEADIELHQKMMEGEFHWTSEGLVLKEP